MWPTRKKNNYLIVSSAVRSACTRYMHIEVGQTVEECGRRVAVMLGCQVRHTLAAFSAVQDMDSPRGLHATNTMARQGALRPVRNARSMYAARAARHAARLTPSKSGGRAHGVDAVRDDEQRAAWPPRAARDGRAQRALDRRVGRTVHVGGRLVQRQDRRVRQQRPAAPGAMLSGGQAPEKCLRPAEHSKAGAWVCRPA